MLPIELNNSTYQVWCCDQDGIEEYNPVYMEIYAYCNTVDRNMSKISMKFYMYIHVCVMQWYDFVSVCVV